MPAPAASGGFQPAGPGKPMTAPRSDFLRTLQDRGFIHQCTDLEALDAGALAGRITAYIGFDATADSLHIGHLVQIMMLRWLQKTRSEEHTSELQSLMRISYAVFCLKKKTIHTVTAYM